MNKEPASKETLMGLYKTLGNNFLAYEPIICSIVSTIENLEKVIITGEKKRNEAVKLKIWEIFLRLQVFAMIVNLDLSTFLRANFRTESNPERRSNLKYICVFTLEGYRYLFGSKNDKKNSIWGKFRLLADQTNDNELKSDIYSFEQYAKEFANQYKDIHSRNLSVHYDDQPLKVYKNLEKLSEEYESKRTVAFLGILELLSALVKKHVQRYRVSGVLPTNNYDLTLQEAINIFPDEENKIFNTLADTITSYSTRLDSIVSKCRQLEFINEKFKSDDLFLAQTKTMIESMSPVIHMHFIYLDLASAIRAYLSSEHYFEKQMNLRRINFVVYEGFKHIYGYTEEDHARSFWQKNTLSELGNSTDQNLQDSLTEIKAELNGLATDKDINNERLRECCIHYRYKVRDNIIPLFHLLVEFNPFVEMNKARKLIEILPRLIELNTVSMKIVNKRENDKRRSSNDEIMEKLDNTREMIEKSTATFEQKQNFIETINKIKNMLAHKF